MNRRRHLAAWACFTFGTANLSFLFAQTASYGGAVRGTVLDDSGALVSEAKISLTEQSKGLARATESDSAGLFLFSSLTAGAYSVTVTKVGFSTEQVKDLRIAVGEQISLVLILHVGASHSEITVRPPDTTALTAESNTLGSVIDSSRVQGLPLNGRYFLELSELAGGSREVSAASNLFTTNVGPPDRTVVLPGTLPNSVNYYLNGIDITGSRDGELALSPSIAAIDQFKVHENFLMPDEGTNPALVNIVTKSGSNQFHGEAYEFLRNRLLDARSFFAAVRDDVKLNQFGSAAGGPLRKNRLWFYAFYEGLREVKAFQSVGYDPTAAMFAGNLGGAGSTIYDPLTYNAASNQREPFADNRIPSSRINGIAKKLLQYYIPGSSLASVPSNIFGNPRNTQNDNQAGIRLDASLSPSSQLFGQFFYENGTSDQPGLFPFSGLLYLNSSELAMVQHSWSLSPGLMNSLRVGFLRNIAIGGNEAQNGGPNPASIGITNTFSTAGVTAVNLQGYSSFGRANGEIGNRDNTWQLNEELTFARGGHAFRFGAGLHYRRGWHLNGNASALGILSFQPVFTAQLSQSTQGQQLAPLANTGNSFADFLLGYPVTGMLIGLPVIQLRSTQFTPYFQDSWRLKRNLTLNYGISWFLETPPEPQGWARHYIHSFDFNTGLLAFAALGQMSYNPVATDENNFAPRFGLAWTPSLLKGTVVRTGAGVYYSQFPWVLAVDSVQGPPAGFGQNFANSQSNPLPTYVLGRNVFSPPSTAAVTPSFAAHLPPGTIVQGLSPNFRTAHVSQWNFSLQHSAGLNDSFELDYLGSSGHHLPILRDASQCPPTPHLFCDPGSRPYPQYGLVLYADSAGDSSYQAVIAKYEHRASGGLSVHLEYALAKSLTDAWQSSLQINQISSCQSCSKGPATFDVRQRAVASFLWTVPIGRSQQFGQNLPEWVNVAVGAWTLSAITTFAAGEPIVLTAPNQTGSPIINPLPDRICDGRGNHSSNIRRTGMVWFDPSCFPVPAVGYFGNSGATVLNAPGLDNWDVALAKTLAVTRETLRVQLRAELFNAWNHTQFEPPNSNAGAGANFGRISAARPPRLMQVAFKLQW